MWTKSVTPARWLIMAVADDSRGVSPAYPKSHTRRQHPAVLTAARELHRASTDRAPPDPDPQGTGRRPPGRRRGDHGRRPRAAGLLAVRGFLVVAGGCTDARPPSCPPWSR